MAIIRSYEGESVPQGGMSGARINVQSTAAGAGAVASGLDAVASEKDRQLQVDRQRADETALIDADRKLGDWELQKLHDPQNGALATRGQNALGIHSPTMEDFDKTASEIQQGLTSDDQRQAFDRIVNRRRYGVDLAVQNHIAQQSEVYQAETDNDAIATARSTAIAKADTGDWPGIQQDIERQRMVIVAAAQRNGKGAEWENRASAEAESATHVGVISRMLDQGRDADAAKYYGDTKDAIVGEQRGGIERSLDVGATRGQAQGIVDGLLSQKGEDGQGLPLDDGLERIAAQTKDNPKLREQAEERWTLMHSRRQQAAGQAQDDAFAKGYSALTAPGNGSGLDAVPSSVLAAMGPEHEMRLRQLAAKGPPQTSDRSVYLYLQRLAVDNPTEFSKPTTVLKYSPDLSDSDFKEFSKLSADVAKQGVKAPKVQSLQTRDQVVDSTLRQFFGKDRKDWPSDAWQVEDRFKLVMDKAIEAESGSLKPGEAIDNERVRGIANRLLVQEAQKDPRGWYNPARWFGDAEATSQVPAFQLRGADRLAFSAAQVPQAYRANIEAAIRTQGGVVTDDAVLAAYNAAVARANAASGK